MELLIGITMLAILGYACWVAGMLWRDRDLFDEPDDETSVYHCGCGPLGLCDECWKELGTGD